MLAIEVALLTGRYVATAHDDRSQAEWPPHPARLHSALVAAWADVDEPDAAEVDVLRVLERLAPPAITCGDPSLRTAVTHYVPVNDIAVVGNTDMRAARLDAALAVLADDTSPSTARRKAERNAEKERDVARLVAPDERAPTRNARELLPSGRGRQGRMFPSVTPDDPTVLYTWLDGQLTEEQSATLDGLLARVVRIGHSSSLVSCRLTGASEPPTFLPSVTGAESLRTAGPGQFDALQQAFERHRGSRPRTMPGRTTRYSRQQGGDEADGAEPVATASTSGEWFTFEFDQSCRRQAIFRCTAVARALRGALLSYATEPHPEALSGHSDDRTPSRDPHIGFVALPFVDHPHATGSLIGAAIVLPVGAGRELRRSVAMAIAAWPHGEGQRRRLTLGRSGVIFGEFLEGQSSSRSLDRRSWARPSRSWVSVTPVALPRHPGRLDHPDVNRRAVAWERTEAMVVEACRHVGLPAPQRIVVGHAPFLVGSAPSSRFPVFRQFDRNQGQQIARLQVHVTLEFAEAVAGPLVLGSGRYLGLGLMRPVVETRS